MEHKSLKVGALPEYWFIIPWLCARGAGILSVIALWNFLLLGSTVTIGETATPRPRSLAVNSGSIGWAWNFFYFKLEDILILLGVLGFYGKFLKKFYFNQQLFLTSDFHSLNSVYLDRSSIRRTKQTVVKIQLKPISGSLQTKQPKIVHFSFYISWSW